MEKATLNDLLTLMARLRNPDGGCPWDLEQDFKTIAPHTIEEAYEVAAAIEENDMESLKDELGDLLFQVVFHAQMAEEKELFNFHDVVGHVTAKMTHRHPHVFGTEVSAQSAADVNVIWEQRKDLESKRQGAPGTLDDVSDALPAILRAQKLQKRAARVGFEWPEAIQVLDKIEEEIAELRQALKNKDQVNIAEETGDLLFCAVNLGRMLSVDCEFALQSTNNKFKKRFNGIESELKAKNKTLQESTLEEMDTLWTQQKQKEKATS